MKITPAEINDFLELLEQVPRRIADAASQVDGSRLSFKLNRKSWSANDVLAHIRSCADMWGGSIESMIAKDNPTLPDIHPRQWIKQTNYTEIDFHHSFKIYLNQRKELLKILKALSFEDWSRSAIIGGRKHTVFSQVRRMARHETEHCEQIEAFLG